MTNLKLNQKDLYAAMKRGRNHVDCDEAYKNSFDKLESEFGNAGMEADQEKNDALNCVFHSGGISELMRFATTIPGAYMISDDEQKRISDNLLSRVPKMTKDLAVELIGYRTDLVMYLTQKCG